MLPVTINISKMWTKILSTAAILATLTGTFTISGGIRWVGRELGTHEELDHIAVLKDQTQDLIDYQEMSWEVFRLLTDDDDSLAWQYVDDMGQAFDVDIRSTAEDVELAFIFQTHMMYPVYYSPADRKKYIMVHDHHSGHVQNYYLYLK